MKKILYTALIILIVFNSAGYIFTYWQLKMIFRNTARSSSSLLIPAEQLQIFILHNGENPVLPDNLVKENEDEFQYNGEMFDIVRSEVKGDFIYYYCRRDDNENRLESAFINYIQENSGALAGTVPVKNLIKDLSVDWEPVYKQNFFFTAAGDLNLTSEYKLLTAFSLIHTPPPRPYYI